MKIFNETMQTLEKAMDVRMANQRVIAANLANMDTPGFQAQSVDFEQSLTNALNGQADPAVIKPTGDVARTLDGNNVDQESELTKMTRNRIMYTLSAQLMSAKFRNLTTILDSEK